MNAGVGSSASVNGNDFAGKAMNGVFQPLLHGVESFLLLPTVIRRAYIVYDNANVHTNHLIAEKSIIPGNQL